MVTAVRSVCSSGVLTACVLLWVWRRLSQDSLPPCLHVAFLTPTHPGTSQSSVSQKILLSEIHKRHGHILKWKEVSGIMHVRLEFPLHLWWPILSRHHCDENPLGGSAKSTCAGIFTSEINYSWVPPRVPWFYIMRNLTGYNIRS